MEMLEREKTFYFGSLQTLLPELESLSLRLFPRQKVDDLGVT